MKYRTRTEIQELSLAQVLDEMNRLKIEPEGHRVYPADVVIDGIPSACGEPPAYLSIIQQRECRELGGVGLTFKQQVEHETSLDLWRIQIHQHEVYTYVQSLGLAKCLRELKARKVEMTPWEKRQASRNDIEKRLCLAIARETESGNVS